MSKKKQKSKKAEEKIRIKFCPKCKSTAVIPLAGGQIGVFQCVNCKFTGSIFPEKEINLDKLKKEKEK